MLMENVQSFLNAAKKYGVADEEVFQTPDLFEARNLPQVALCIFSLGNTTLYTRAANDPSVFIITEKAPIRSFSWLKVPNLRHYEDTISLPISHLLTMFRLFWHLFSIVS